MDRNKKYEFKLISATHGMTENLIREKFFLAQFSEQIHRYEDMLRFIDEAINLKNGADFTDNERIIIKVGFKNMIGSLRSALKIIQVIYKENIQVELFEKCKIIINILKYKCLSIAHDDKSKAFFHKMLGDYYRYLAENSENLHL